MTPPGGKNQYAMRQRMVALVESDVSKYCQVLDRTFQIPAIPFEKISSGARPRHTQVGAGMRAKKIGHEAIQKKNSTMNPTEHPCSGSQEETHLARKKHRAGDTRATVHYQPSDPEVTRRVRLTIQRCCPTWLLKEREDLIQRAILRLLEKSQKIESKHGFCASYIYQTATSVVIDEVRKRRKIEMRTVPQESGDKVHFAEPDSSTSPTHALRMSRLQSALHQCMVKLRKDRRIAISLKMQGHSYREISHILDWNEKRAQNMANRGRADLRACLEKKGLTTACHSE